jgi:hypothetical protein
LGRAERKNTATPSHDHNHGNQCGCSARNAHSHRAASAAPLFEAVDKKFKGNAERFLLRCKELEHGLIEKGGQLFRNMHDSALVIFGVIPIDIIFEKYIGKSQVAYAYSRWTSTRSRALVPSSVSGSSMTPMTSLRRP